MNKNTRRFGLAAAGLAMLCASMLCIAHDGGSLPGETVATPEPIDQALQATVRGHGSISIGYVDTLVNGFHPPHGDLFHFGHVRSHSISLDVDYFVLDNWSVQAGIPYIDNRFTGVNPHCPTAAPPQCVANHIPVLKHPHPESEFLDNGTFHGTAQDWHFGATYHANIGDYFLAPSLTLYVPSHDYTFFAQSAVGQDLQRVELAATLAHQFEFSNLYYRIGFGRAFSEKTLGQSIDYNKLDLELGYFINERWTAKLFATAKKGNGYDGPYDPTSELFFHHDQRAPHNYAGAGFGADYHVNDKYTLSSSLQREIWGRVIFNFEYAFELRLTREF